MRGLGDLHVWGSRMRVSGLSRSAVNTKISLNPIHVRAMRILLFACRAYFVGSMNIIWGYRRTQQAYMRILEKIR